MNNFELQSFIKGNMIDLVFSSSVIRRGKWLSHNMKNFEFHANPITVPIYIFSITEGKKLTMSTAINTHLLSREKYCEDAIRSYSFNNNQLKPFKPNGTLS